VKTSKKESKKVINCLNACIALPYPKLPVLYVDGKPIFQSVAIARFAARKGGLIPKDDLNAAICDEVMDSIADVVNGNMG